MVSKPADVMLVRLYENSAYKGLPREGGLSYKVHVACRYDTGPILAQAVVPVSPTDTPVKLAAKVLKEVRSAWHAGWKADGVFAAAPLKPRWCP